MKRQSGSGCGLCGGNGHNLMSSCFVFVKDTQHWQDGDPVVYQQWDMLSKKYTSASVRVISTHDLVLWRRCHPASSRCCIEDLVIAREIQNTFPGRHHSCSALLLLDIAQPLWYSIDCNKKHLFNVVCKIPQATETEEPYLIVQPTKRYCRHVKIFGICHKFEWIFREEFNQQNCEQHVQNAKVLLDAQFSDSFPLFLTSVSTGFQFSRYEIHSSGAVVKDTHEGMCMKSVAFERIFAKGNLFGCACEAFISVRFVCDAKRDCPGEIQNDEAKETCNNTHNTTQGNISGATEECGPLLHKDKTGHCTVYGQPRKTKQKYTVVASEEQNTFYGCRSGKPIHKKLLNDLVPDCAVFNGDETLLFSMIQNHSSFACTMKYQIPCRHGHSRCYNISEICKFALNEHNHLVSCRTGEHLGQCKAAECSMMFKCPNSYCIPQQYICDGKLDCPSGSDESASHLCGPQRHCQCLFKCQKIQICIHIIRVCDGKDDCPTGDDEDLCVLKEVWCHEHCKCLAFATICSKIALTPAVAKVFYHFHIIFLLDSNIFHRTDLTNCTKLIMLNINFPGVYLCDLLKFDLSLEVISAPANQISDLVFQCFQKTPKMQVIDLHQNWLSFLPVGLFKDLVFLDSLNISGNPIQQLLKNSFVNLPNLTVLSLLNTNITSADDTIFHSFSLKLLETHSPLTCCLVSNQEICSTSLLWFQMCTDLLSNVATKVAVGCVGLITVVINLLSLILQKVYFKRNIKMGTEKTGAFGAVVASVNIADLMCVVPLLVLWVVDQANVGHFNVKKVKWQSSIFCFIIFSLFSLYSVLSLQVLCLFTYTRFSVVDHPMDTKFKETKFVLRWIVGLFLSCILSSSVLTILTWVVDNLVRNAGFPVPLCVPFVDFNKTLVMAKVITFLTLGSQIGGIIFIIVMYIKLYLSLKASQRRIAELVSKKQSNRALITQIILFMTCTTLCWVSTNIVFLVCMHLEQYPVVMVTWTVTVAYPLNAFMNPVILLFTTIRKMLKEM